MELGWSPPLPQFDEECLRHVALTCLVEILKSNIIILNMFIKVVHLYLLNQ